MNTSLHHMDNQESNQQKSGQGGGWSTSIQVGTEDFRRRRLVEINSRVESDGVLAERKRLEGQHGHIWDAPQLAQDFDVLGFMAPYAVVRRRSDGRKGSLEFQHQPRFYFNFVLD